MATIPKIEIEVASVKVMRSHDYCHFEVCLTSSFHKSLFKGEEGEENCVAAVDELRKTAARLADKAVEQYKVAKFNSQKLLDEKNTRQWAINEAKRVEAIPEGDRTVREQAALKAYKDDVWQASREYDYEDQWDEENQ